MKEIWKDIEGYEGLYQVSNLGRVKSLPRLVYNHTGYINRGEVILKQSTYCKYYKQVSLLYNNTYWLRNNQLLHRRVD